MYSFDRLFLAADGTPHLQAMKQKNLFIKIASNVSFPVFYKFGDLKHKKKCDIKDTMQYIL